MDFIANGNPRANIVASQFSTGLGGSLSFQTSDSGGAITERMRLDHYGNVGIGNTTPMAKLDVAGQIVSRQTGQQTGSTVDFNASNSVVNSSPGGGSLNLQGLVPGGSYTLLITDAVSRTYTFGNCTNSHFKPANGPTLASTHTIYSIQVFEISGATHCYIAWSTGF